MSKQGQKAINRNIIIKGVKGRYIISALPNIDISTCFIPEYNAFSFAGSSETVHRFLV
jgi:hypothetical protein